MFEDIKITDILTSIGTIGAVIVSVYLAVRNDRKRAVITHSRGVLREKTQSGENITGIDRLCFYNKGIKKIHLRKMLVYRKASLFSKKALHINFGGISEFNREIAGDSIEIVDIDFTYDDEIQEVLGVDVSRLNKVYVIFEDVAGKKYKTKFKLYYFNRRSNKTRKFKHKFRFIINKIKMKLKLSRRR